VCFEYDIAGGLFPAQDAITATAGLTFLFWTDQAFPFYGLR